MNISCRFYFVWVALAATAMSAVLLCAQEPVGGNSPGASPVLLSVQSAGEPEKKPARASAESFEDLPLGPAGSGGGDSASGNPASAAGWGRTFGALALVLGLIVAARWALLAWGSRRGRVPLTRGLEVEILGRQKISSRHHLVFLRLGQRIIVASEGSGGLATLAQITDPGEVAFLLARVEASRERSSTAGFRAWMNQFHMDHDSAENGAGAGRLKREEEGADDQEQYFDRARDEVQGLLTRIRQLQSEQSGGGR